MRQTIGWFRNYSTKILIPQQILQLRIKNNTSLYPFTEALKTLKQIGWAADYIITHCAPNSVVKKLNPDYDLDQLTAFLEKIRRKAKFHYWLFGHYHDNKIINERYVLLWEQIVQIK